MPRRRQDTYRDADKAERMLAWIQCPLCDQHPGSAVKLANHLWHHHEWNHKLASGRVCPCGAIIGFRGEASAFGLLLHLQSVIDDRHATWGTVETIVHNHVLMAMIEGTGEKNLPKSEYSG